MLDTCIDIRWEVGLLLKPCNEGGGRDERTKRFFSVIPLLCSAGIPTDKRGGNLIGTDEMGHWGGNWEDDIKIWMRDWGIMAKKGKLRRFWNNHIENIMKPGISLASLRPQGSLYTFAHSMCVNAPSSSALEGLTPLTRPTGGVLCWTLCQSTLRSLSPTSCQGCSAFPRRRSYFPFSIASLNFHHSSWKFLLDFLPQAEKQGDKTINLFLRKKIEREIIYTQ